MWFYLVYTTVEEGKEIMREKSVIQDNKTKYALWEMDDALKSLEILETIISNHGIRTFISDACIVKIQEGLDAANSDIRRYEDPTAPKNGW